MSLVLCCAVALGSVVPATAATAPVVVRPAFLAPGQAPAGAKRLGTLAPSTAVHISVTLAPSNSSGLKATLAGLYDPTSTNYHRWLTPAQYAAAFAPTTAQVGAVESWLHGAGLTNTAFSGAAVQVSADASAVVAALGTGLEEYRTAAGHTGYIAVQAPRLPASLASGQITGILGLDTLATFRSDIGGAPQRGTTSSVSQGDADGLSACPAAVAASDDGNAYTLDQLGGAYGLGSLIDNGQNGHGQTVGVYELDPYSTSDIATYESCFGLTNPVSTAYVDGGSESTDPTEPNADIEQIATQAPGSAIVSYDGPNTPEGQYATWAAAISADQVSVISTSWSMCEPDAYQAGLMGAYDGLFEEAAVQGQTILAASGDSGSSGCLESDGDTGLAVTYPSSSPWVTAVGGTTLYGPGDEPVWNVCQYDESSFCADEEGGAGASGGGLSYFEGRPAYEPNDYAWSDAEPCGTQCRETPDISANAGTPMVFYDEGQWSAAEGTSFSAPFMAGVFADIADGCTTPAGLENPTLYSLYEAGSYGSAFNDITVGDTDLTGQNGGAFPALSGWDAASGIGSPLASGLDCAEVLTGGTGAAGTELSVNGLGLEHASFTIGGQVAPVVSQTATTATIVVPAGSGTETIAATSVIGPGTQTASFTYPAPVAPPPPPPPPPTPSPPPPYTAPGASHGYWLVGADGGIFSFGDAGFHGSTGNLRLNRPVVGITPTADRGGYWLVASDGGIFSFGNSGFYGSIPGLGISPAGTGGGRALNAPIVGMVPSANGDGYFMVAADGGVFAFGGARFEGSCPSIGGCSGQAVAVMPDASGDGYWLVTTSGAVYTFGDARYYGSPGPGSSPITSAVRTADGNGYWILSSSGTVTAYGDASNQGSVPAGGAGGSNPASAIFASSTGGYWVATATGSVFSFGAAPYDGSEAGAHLNAPIIAASGS